MKHHPNCRNPLQNEPNRTKSNIESACKIGVDASELADEFYRKYFLAFLDKSESSGLKLSEEMITKIRENWELIKTKSYL